MTERAAGSLVARSGLPETGVGFRLAALNLAPSSRRVALGARLASVVPRAERLEVLQPVIVGGNDMVDIGRRVPASTAEGVAGLAGVAVAGEHTDAESVPVAGEP